MRPVHYKASQIWDKNMINKIHQWNHIIINSTLIDNATLGEILINVLIFIQLTDSQSDTQVARVLPKFYQIN